MRIVPWIFLLTAASMSKAQDPTLAGCGPRNQALATQTGSSGQAEKAHPGDVQVFLTQVQAKTETICVHCLITIEVGMDGHWVTALQGGRHTVLTMPPGHHHLCVVWKSRRSSLSRLTALSDLSAEAGSTYYFAAHTAWGTEYTPLTFSLDRVNPDQGQLLVSQTKDVADKH